MSAEISAGDVVVVSPDVGGVARARKFAMILGTDIAIVDKRRSYDEANKSEVMNIIGNVNGRIAILVDDLIDTAGTICHAANSISECGASNVYACATHAVLSGKAIENILKSKIDKLIFTDTIPMKDSCEKIKYISIAPLFVGVIKNVYNGKSVSESFE